MTKDFYLVLNVPRNASPEAIQASYRNLAMENHPDRGGDPGKFKEIATAYKTLSDPAKRRQYDESERKRPVEDLPEAVHQVVDEYFSQFSKA